MIAVKKTAPRFDNIPYWVIKHCTVELTCVIAGLVNKTMNIGRPPLAWKNALVIPMPKVSLVKSFADFNLFKLLNFLDFILL